MRYRALISTALAAFCASALSLLNGCGGSTGSSVNRSLIGTWNGSITRAAESLDMSITFSASGGRVTGKAVLALFDEPTYQYRFLEGYAEFPVSVAGNQATFTATFLDRASTNVSVATGADRKVLAFPNRQLGPLTVTLSTAPNQLTGAYQLGGTRPQSGVVSLAPGPSPVPLDGHWLGTMISTPGQPHADMELYLQQDPASAYKVMCSDVAKCKVTTAFATNTWGPPAPTGVDAIVIGSSFYCNLNFVVKDAGAAGMVVAHRYLKGTVSGSTITGTYLDEPTAGNPALDTGTFTLVRQ